MASITLRFPPPSLRYSSCSYPSRARFSCSATLSPPHHVSRKGFMDFPYVMPSHKNLMVDLASTIETHLGAILKPCSLPPDTQSYHNETKTAHAALHLKTGIQSSKIDFVLGSWIHCELPSGGALNITSRAVYLNTSTDAPDFLVELIQNSPA